MNKLLRLLARATDTKGYPDDKDPNHWRTINHSKVHVDANGNIDGGAGQKFNGNQWTSTKHPHNPASYPQAAAPAPPPVTTADLKKAWRRVGTIYVQMQRATKAATYSKQQANLQSAIQAYLDLNAKADPSVANSFKPNVQLMQTRAQQQFTPKGTAQASSPLSSLAASTQPAAQPAPAAAPQPQTPLGSLAANTQPQGLQSQPVNANINQGRNVKIYNLAQKGINALRQFVYDKRLNIPGSVLRQSDANALGKIISQELSKLNQNYGHTTVADIQKMDTKALLRKLGRKSKLPLNPTLDNDKKTLKLSMMLGNNNPPRVVSDAEFKKIAKNSSFPVMYRGVGRTPDFDAKTIVDDFKYGDTTWIGGSACYWGAGMYSSTREGYASYYGSKVITMIPDPQKAKVIEWDDLCDEAKKRGILKSCNYTGGGDTKHADEMSVLALQLGYNIIKINGGNGHRKGSSSNPNGHYGDFYNILDRSCLIVKK